jgi:hypothetical protein
METWEYRGSIAGGQWTTANDGVCGANMRWGGFAKSRTEALAVVKQKQPSMGTTCSRLED